VSPEPLQSLRKAMLAFETYRNEVARFYGLSVLETQAVSQLVAHGDCGPGDLAGRLGITPGSATALLDRLAQEGIVARGPHPSDRRRSVVSLTDHGRSLVAEASRWFAHAFDGFDEAALPEVVRTLDLLAANMDRQTGLVAASAHGAGRASTSTPAVGTAVSG
jgi:DNA-binding MarR family transcriptional regulator